MSEAITKFKELEKIIQDQRKEIIHLKHEIEGKINEMHGSYKWAAEEKKQKELYFERYEKEKALRITLERNNKALTKALGV